ncbi:MAG: DMT family transporter [Pseudomonadota bacterium]
MTALHALILTLICIVWGFHFTVIKVAVAEVPPIAYVAVRMFIVALLLVPFLKWHRGMMRRILVAGVCFGGLNYVFMFSGVKYTSASVGALFVETYVPLATIMSVIFLGEKIRWRRMLGLALAFSGVVVVATAGEEGTGSSNLALGGSLLLAAALCEAFGAITVKRIEGVKPLQLLAWFGIIGTLVTTPMSLAIERDQLSVLTSDARGVALAALLYSVIMVSIVGHASYYWLLQRVDVSQVAGGTVMTTLFAVTFGVLLLDEPLTWQLIVGGIVTLAGVAIIVARSGAKQAQAMATVSEALGQDVGAETQHEKDRT